MQSRQFADFLGAELDTARRSQFLQTIEPERRSRVDDVVVLAHGSAEIDEFVDVVHDAGFRQKAEPGERAGPNSMAIKSSGRGYLILMRISLCPGRMFCRSSNPS